MLAANNGSSWQSRKCSNFTLLFLSLLHLQLTRELVQFNFLEQEFQKRNHRISSIDFMKVCRFMWSKLYKDIGDFKSCIKRFQIFVTLVSCSKDLSLGWFGVALGRYNGNEISKRALIQTCAPFELALRLFDIIRYNHILQLWDYYDNDHNGYLDLMELKVISLIGWSYTFAFHLCPPLTHVLILYLGLGNNCYSLCSYVY